MFTRGGAGTILAAELAADRYLVSVGGILDQGAGEALRDVLLPLAAAEGAAIVLDLGEVALDGYDPIPTLLGAGAIVSSGGGSLTVVTVDRRLRAVLETDAHVAVEATLEERLL
jgi:anti-anti-sigma regulatory factor